MTDDERLAEMARFLSYLSARNVRLSRWVVVSDPRFEDGYWEQVGNAASLAVRYAEPQKTIPAPREDQ